MRKVTGRALVAAAVAIVTGAGAAAAQGAAPATPWSPAAPLDSGEIRGVVVDATSGAPLPGTQVRLVELARGDMTHDDGEFHLHRLPAGTYTLVFHRLGYGQVTRRVTLSEMGTVEMRVELRPAAVQLDEVVVTGTVGTQQSEQAVRPTNVVNAQELDRQLEATIGATLQREPGVAVVSSGPATAKPVIRGLGGDRILVLEDGERPGDLSAAGADHAVAVDPLTAQQIEVVRGPSALLYGSNALGGVVNVVKEEIPSSVFDQVHGTLTLQGQTVNRGVAGGGSATGSIGEMSWRVEGVARTADLVDTPVGRVLNTGYDTYSLSTGAAWVQDWGHVGAAYRFYDSYYGVPPSTVEPEGVDIDLQRHMVRGEARVQPPSALWTLVEIDGAFSRYHHRELEADGAVGVEYGLLTAQTDGVARHGSLGIFDEGAVGFRAQWRDYVAGGEQGNPPTRDYQLAGFVLEELGGERLRLQGGVRYDWHRVVPAEEGALIIGGTDYGQIRERTFGAVSGSVGLLAELLDDVRVGVSVARAFRTPDITELYSSGPHLAEYRFQIGNPDLGDETGVGVDAFLRISRERMRFEIAAFRNLIDDYIFERPTADSTPDDLPIYQFVGQDAELRGVDGQLALYLTDQLVLEGTGSYVWGSLREDDEPLPLMPPLTATAALRYERPAWFAGIGWRGAAEQDRVGEFETPTDGYHLLSLTGGYRWLALGRFHTLTLTVENLTDQEYRQHLSRLKDIQPEPGIDARLLYRMTF